MLFVAKGASLLQKWVNNSRLQSDKSVIPRSNEMLMLFCGVCSDEGGVHGACVVRRASSSLKKLLYQRRLLLLELGDALAPLCHLLSEESVLVLQSLNGLRRGGTWKLGVS